MMSLAASFHTVAHSPSSHRHEWEEDSWAALAI
uniref:Uncharacterized protein n=1 Tax=Anguilla anguilla TaxID=7936 RepID=A0A0E9SWQ5_ANGAN